MRINYESGKGKCFELEVSDEIGTFYLESIDEEKRNDHRNTRRHTLLSTFTHEDKRYFSDKTNIEGDFLTNETVSVALSHLNERQQYLVTKCLIEGYSYCEIARREGKDESTIRHAVNRAKKKLEKYLK